jgi:hypothetical protein
VIDKGVRARVCIYEAATQLQEYGLICCLTVIHSLHSSALSRLFICHARHLHAWQEGRVSANPGRRQANELTLKLTITLENT